MLNAFYELGKLWVEKENIDKFEILIDASKLKKYTKKVLVVKVKETNNGFVYDGVIERDYDSNDNLKYLYKTGSSRGTDITPTCIITDLEEKTLPNKFFKWFEKNEKANDLIKYLNNTLSDYKLDITLDLKDKYENIQEKNNVLLTIAIETQGQLKYIGDYDFFCDILVDNASSKYNKKISGEGACFLCDCEKEVFGLAASSIGFKFSTPDKKGNVPGLNEKEHWKQLPICQDCVLYLEAGKRFVEKYLNFSDFGLRYYVIPKFLFKPKESFDKIYKFVTLKEDIHYNEQLLNHEDRLVKIVSELNDVIEFKFLYYKSSNNSFDILAYVESVLPSWMKKIYDTQYSISQYDFFSEDNVKKIFSKDAVGDFITYTNNINDNFTVTSFNWFYSYLRDFFNNFSSKLYLEMVTSVLAGKKVDYNFLLSSFLGRIRDSWKNGYDIKYNVLKSFCLILLFNNLDLIKGGKLMNIDLDVSETLKEDSSLLDEFIDAPDKRAVFLLGCLTRRLTSKQYKELGSSPFINKLWGLNLDKDKVMKLYPMVINKLREYETAIPLLEENISANFLYAENKWKISRDEISYYFSLGYSLSFAINFKKEETKEKGDIDE